MQMAMVPEPEPGDPPERPQRNTVGVIDPRARAVLEWLDFIGAPRLHTRTVPEARRELRVTIAMTSYVETVGRVQPLTIPGPAGPLAARVYRPRRSDGPLPVLVWFHGGGFVLGDLDTADPTCRALANRSGALVVSVEYRLAPEHEPPAAVEDCLAATAWVAEHAARIGGDGSRLAVGGDSAGGTLAALVAIAARDSGIDLAFQLLVYPATDLTLSHRSVREFGHAPFLLDVPAMNWFVGHYLGRGDARDPAVSPLFASDLSGVAPTLAVVAECDPLRDECDAYVARMRAAGVAAEAVCYPGQIHGFFTMDLVFPASRLAQERAGSALARALGLPPRRPSRLPRVPPNAATLTRVASATAAAGAILGTHHAQQAWNRLTSLTGGLVPASENA
jgi:acetyl esterase/lipase